MLKVQPLVPDAALKERIYAALKDAITAMDLYTITEDPRLDERQLAEDFQVSRTPIREAIARLEQEGLVRTIARRGAYVVRKSKQEILEMIHVWAALESMAARLVTLNATDSEISQLHSFVAEYGDSDHARGHIDEYSETNIAFHQTIIRLSGSKLLKEMSDNLFVHMKAIRARTIKDRDRMAQSVIDHTRIIDALEKRDTDLAEQLVRDHALHLAEHVRKYVDYLD